MTPEQQAAWNAAQQAIWGSANPHDEQLVERAFWVGWTAARQLGEGPPRVPTDATTYWHYLDAKAGAWVVVQVEWQGRKAFASFMGVECDERVSDMPGQWRGPIPLPAEWEQAKGGGT